MCVEWAPVERMPRRRVASATLSSLFDGATQCLAATLFGQPLLQATLLTRLEVEAVLLDVLADAFPLDFAAEATKGLFERFVLTDGDEDQSDSRCFETALEEQVFVRGTPMEEHSMKGEADQGSSGADFGRRAGGARPLPPEKMGKR